MRAPAAFLGHGSPMNAIEQNRYTAAWRRFGRACGVPRGVLCISAHWFTESSAVTAMAQPRTIHDFYGFPQELNDYRYPAPGSPELAAEVAGLLRPEDVRPDSTWGLDHGTWSVLTHAFPAADVPVVQLAINAHHSFEHHMELGRQLAPLRDSGVVIVGSGNLVHNLGRLDWSAPEAAFDWAERFETRARAAILDAPGDAASLGNAPDYRMAAPTPEHFIPLLYFAALAEAAAESAQVLVDGFAYGSISMTSFALGMSPES
ncbi:MAG: 4,5-DOPA dioxygenase extradiol [Actinobacteria bacterium]|nr:MAG: 4,5-DOPA dioxygenase extradiol [Actinomycetota bacterium]